MKHYFIHRKGNDSEKLMKTPMAQRKTIKYHHYHEDYIEVTEIEPGDEGVTEEDIRRYYAAEDSEVYYNLKARRLQRTDEEKARIAKSAVLEKAYRSSDSKPGVVEIMDEIASTWPESWQEIYERILKNGETIVSLARERGVSEGAVRKTLNNIRKALSENPELRKFVRFFD